MSPLQKIYSASIYPVPVYTVLLLIAIACVLALSGLAPSAIVILAPLLAISLLLYRYLIKANKVGLSILCWLLAVLLALVIGIYRPTGFNYPVVLQLQELYAGGLPITLRVNVAKAIAGYTILFFLIARYTSDAYVTSKIKQLLLVMVFGCGVLTVAYSVLDLAFHLKSIKYIAIFGVVNLFVTCVSEEAFMRLLLQEQLRLFLTRWIGNKFWQECIPLLVATAIFVLTHGTHGAGPTLVFALAGFVYGLTYSLTKNIFATIAVHFLVNILHFSFLTYPLA